MKKNNSLLMLVLMLLSANAFAYGGGGSSSSKACAKPKFSAFKPAENSEVVPPGSAFSFTASKNTYPGTIKVTVKGKPTTVQTTPQNDGSFTVSGKLPDGIKGDFARISITADAQSNCNGTGGWLVKISE